MPKTIHIPNQAAGVVHGILQRRLDEYAEDIERAKDCPACKRTDEAGWADMCAHHSDIRYLSDLVNEVVIQLR